MAIASAMLILAACGKKEKEFDATGTFEATETTVYAEQSGTLVLWNVVEGKEMAAKEEAGLIDTTQIWLNIKQLEAMKEVYQSQLDKAEQELRRYRELVAEGAAPSKMLDDADSQVQVLQKQLEAQLSSLNTGTKTLDKQIAAADVQICALNDQLNKCHISAPIGGTVLEKYVEYGEFVATGKPLFKIADINNMFIRAYVTSSQLQHIKLGQTVKVYADYGDGQKKTYDGFVSWISSSSEFTPKTILTDDERADLVYAIKVAVKNDGYIKIGMYGEVKF